MSAAVTRERPAPATRGPEQETAPQDRTRGDSLPAQLPSRVILLDLVMPVMNGWEFRREQRRDPALAAIPVVICSSTDNIRAEANLIGADGFLEKPVEPDELAAALRPFVDGRLA